MFGGCDEQSVALGDMHTLLLAPEEQERHSCCRVAARRVYKLLFSLSLQQADDFSNRLHAQVCDVMPFSGCSLSVDDLGVPESHYVASSL